METDPSHDFDVVDLRIAMQPLLTDDGAEAGQNLRLSIIKMWWEDYHPSCFVRTEEHVFS